MIHIRSDEEIEKIKKACVIAAKALAEVRNQVVSGISTAQLDSIGEKVILENGGVPVFKGYRGYRHATCISINNQVVHGIPGKLKIENGDILGIDIGVEIDGYCGDVAERWK